MIQQITTDNITKLRESLEKAKELNVKVEQAREDFERKTAARLPGPWGRWAWQLRLWGWWLFELRIETLRAAAKRAQKQLGKWHRRQT